MTVVLHIGIVRSIAHPISFVNSNRHCLRFSHTSSCRGVTVPELTRLFGMRIPNAKRALYNRRHSILKLRVGHLKLQQANIRNVRMKDESLNLRLRSSGLSCFDTRSVFFIFYFFFARGFSWGFFLIFFISPRLPWSPGRHCNKGNEQIIYILCPLQCPKMRCYSPCLGRSRLACVSSTCFFGTPCTLLS